MRKLLLIDSNPTSAVALAEACSAGSWFPGGVLAAANEAEAHRLIETDGGAIGLAIVGIDEGAPDLTGLFRATGRRDLRMPRIAITGAMNVAGVREALREGAADFLTRPVSVADAIAAIDRVMTETERRRRNWQDRSDYSALMREVEIAAKMQQQILPTRFPSDGRVEVHGAMRPAKLMGGDFYDVFRLDETRIGFAIGDVAGKSVPAAFYMAVARTLLRSAADSETSPAACMARVDRLLSDYDIPGIFVTAFLGMLDTDTNRLSYANAGHCLPWLGDGAGAIRPLDGGRSTVLGIGAGLAYEEAEATLPDGGFLFLYT
ncbi:MAG: SpoIIE family protein phosphatase, partial [Rhodospirillales bacterium]